MKTSLHYIYDPLCGWCYAAAPLIKVAREILPVQAHGGGMMTGNYRQTVTPQLREYIKQHDKHIAEVSGQLFGEAYTNGLLNDTTTIFDSEPPTAAMLAAEAITGRGLDMLARLQTAHYVDGLHISDTATLIKLSNELGLDSTKFAKELDVQKTKVKDHIQQTRQLMNRVGAQGFPALVIESAEGNFTINFSKYIGQPELYGTYGSSEGYIEFHKCRPPIGCCCLYFRDLGVAAGAALGAAAVFFL